MIFHHRPEVDLCKPQYTAGLIIIVKTGKSTSTLFSGGMILVTIGLFKHLADKFRRN